MRKIVYNYSQNLSLYIILLLPLSTHSDLITHWYNQDIAIISPYFFTNQPTFNSFKVINCSLSNNKNSLCYQISFFSNPIKDGPYCPKTLDDVAGLYNYDGYTNPGFQALARPFFEAMEQDGFDIVDDKGNIRISPPRLTNGKLNYCFEALHDDNLILTYTIPIKPEYLDKPTPNNSVFNMIGITLNGIPIDGPAPSVVNGAPLPDGNKGPSGNVPAIDPCGGHLDRLGYYHFHMFPDTRFRSF